MRNRSSFPETASNESLWRDASGHEMSLHRIGALLGEHLIKLLRSTGIRVSADFDVQRRIVVQKIGDGLENRFTFDVNDRAVEFE